MDRETKEFRFLSVVICDVMWYGAVEVGIFIELSLIFLPKFYYVIKLLQ